MELDAPPSYPCGNSEGPPLKIAQCAVDYNLIDGDIILNISSDLLTLLQERKYSSCSLVVQLRCVLKLGNYGEDVLLFDRRQNILTECSPFPNGKMSTGHHRVIFKLYCGTQSLHCPPSIQIRALGYANSGIVWSLAAWVEATTANGYIVSIERLAHSVTLTLDPQCVGYTSQEVAPPYRTFISPADDHDIKIFALLSQWVPGSFDVKLETIPKKTISVLRVDLEIETVIEIASEQHGKMKIRRAELLETIECHKKGRSPFTLLKTKCKLPNTIPRPYTSSVISWQHTWCIVVVKKSGSTTHRSRIY